jgi:hypothetical protein
MVAFGTSIPIVPTIGRLAPFTGEFPFFPFTPNLNFPGGDVSFFSCIFWMPFTSGTGLPAFL